MMLAPLKTSRMWERRALARAIMCNDDRGLRLVLRHRWPAMGEADKANLHRPCWSGQRWTATRHRTCRVRTSCFSLERAQTTSAGCELRAVMVGRGGAGDSEMNLCYCRSPFWPPPTHLLFPITCLLAFPLFFLSFFSTNLSSLRSASNFSPLLKLSPLVASSTKGEIFFFPFLYIVVRRLL